MERKLKEKLVHMLGLLGSDQDGELVAAARAVQRLLKANNLTFGDMKTALLDADGRPQVIIVEREPTRHRQLDTAAELMKVVYFMQARERGFVEQMHRHMKENPKFCMSEKQENWFYMLHARYVRA